MTTNPISNADSALNQLYAEYQSFVKGGGNGSFTSSQAALLMIDGTNVKIDIQGTGDPSAFTAALAAAGMQVSSTANVGAGVIAEGFIAISQLPTVAALPQTVGLHAVYRPMLR